MDSLELGLKIVFGEISIFINVIIVMDAYSSCSLYSVAYLPWINNVPLNSKMEKKKNLIKEAVIKPNP